MFWYSWIDPWFIACCIAVPIGLLTLAWLFWKRPERLKVWERWALVLLAIALVAVPPIVLVKRMDVGEEKAYRPWPKVYE